MPGLMFPVSRFSPRHYLITVILVESAPFLSQGHRFLSPVLTHVLGHPSQHRMPRNPLMVF